VEEESVKNIDKQEEEIEESKRDYDETIDNSIYKEKNINTVVDNEDDINTDMNILMAIEDEKLITSQYEEEGWMNTKKKNKKNKKDIQKKKQNEKAQSRKDDRNNLCSNVDHNDDHHTLHTQLLPQPPVYTEPISSTIQLHDSPPPPPPPPPPPAAFPTTTPLATVTHSSTQHQRSKLSKVESDAEAFFSKRYAFVVNTVQRTGMDAFPGGKQVPVEVIGDHVPGFM